MMSTFLVAVSLMPFSSASALSWAIVRAVSSSSVNPSSTAAALAAAGADVLLRFVTDC